MLSIWAQSTPPCLEHHSLTRIIQRSKNCYDVYDSINTRVFIQARLCEMGCFGVGISRLLQATLEHSCSVNGDDDRISWPLTITPFTVCVLPLTTSQV